MDQVLATMQASKLRRATREKTLEDFIHVKLPDNAKHRLEIKLVGVKSSEFVRTTEQGLRLFTKYQTTVHKERADEADYDSFKGFLIDSPLKVRAASRRPQRSP
ncbi:arginyl-tRNA--protein transferase 1-like isoform X1 [Diaphorina citri]|uniref:Arginyl-tRNA--protein transferase 1-like isoform X1 n=1 Tax=Diaphorina citri TaxID=121845 RepID=A0A3Q0JJR7_DIACI|nr:arginyl-tRNA--protein transferase 1-like isoform X1 [Diaphorina citri]